uniref:Uncharacterized protein n=1 Tax=Schizaphis graminum TaxID=13262 RepID=A0A2S2NKT6_SCHGA
MWSVVHFKLDDTVEVVPKHWFNKGYCAWPNTTKKSQLKKAIMSRMNPEKNKFNFFEARTLALNINDFEVAQKKCSLAKSKSDLSSAEDSIKIRKVRKRKEVSISDTDGDVSDESHKSANSIPLYCSTDDELNFEKSAIQISAKPSKIENLTISKKPINGWSPLKSSVNSSFGKQLVNSKNINKYEPIHYSCFLAHITSPLSQKTDLLDIKSQNSNTKIKDNAIANSIPSNDEIARADNYSMIFSKIIMLLCYSYICRLGLTNT